ncbi:hypothetical protein DFP73DRAFT_244528 [Morchella snyderi]|nr:hypothetical protein DFP73DRAFT_244528 [Morchella snyderi]
MSLNNYMWRCCLFILLAGSWGAGVDVDGGCCVGRRPYTWRSVGGNWLRVSFWKIWSRPGISVCTALLAAVCDDETGERANSTLGRQRRGWGVAGEKG